MNRGTPPYRLVRTAPPPVPPLVPDAEQRRVLEHAGGPLLVLAGPGTGKTTTLVEAVARRIERGVAADRVLVLTFSRKAAQELRERITARLGATTAGPAAWTFHAWCYAVVRAWAQPSGHGQPLRLLSGPEQDVALRELLRGTLDTGRPRWPSALRDCLPTRGLAEEVRALLARAREVGVGPDELAELAAAEGRADWDALATFFAEYLDVLDAQGALDYAELVHRAGVLATRPDVAAELRDRYEAVFVDEYQDTDPAQERLLSAVAGGGRELVVVGDPDQAIYAFRGAEVAGLLEFPRRFRHADGRPAEVVALRTCRRSGPRLLAASRRVAWRIPTPGLPMARVVEHRELRAADAAARSDAASAAAAPAGSSTDVSGDPPAGPSTHPPAGPSAGSPGRPAAAGSGEGMIAVRTYPSVGAEADAIADLLRREHLENGTSWDRMAVLVRSGVRSVPLLRRVLGSAGVPLEVAGDELPLAREPAVAPLLLALRCADDPRELTAERARLLLTSALGGADATALRRLGRALRAFDRAALAADPDAPSRLPKPSSELLREAVAHPAGLLALVEEKVAAPARRLADLLDTARAVLLAGGAPEDALWELWAGSPWRRRLEALSPAGGPAGRAADRDLDAVVALFAAVGRASERRGQAAAVGPLLDELEAQQIPGDTLAERGTRGAAVRLLTAHRSKGLEWDIVVVCGVQEGVWPDLRRRNSLLSPERLDHPDAGGVRVPSTTADLLVDERRLFYVAITRARRRLVITAVEGTDEDGERPSRFLGELGVDIRRVKGRVSGSLSLPTLVATLRRHSVDPDVSPALRAAAVARLASLAAATSDDGRPLVPAAHPARWWGLLEPTSGAVPVQPPDRPISLSGTSLSSIEECPLRWFLEHEVHAQQPSTAAMGFGGVVHALADEVARGRTRADLETLDARLESVWRHLGYEAAWQSDQQRIAAREALGRFLAWHTAARGRHLVATEISFEVDLPVADRTVRLRGFMDRVEIDDDGKVHVVDFKTGKTPPSGPQVQHHPQLGGYQLAVRAGALDEALGRKAEVGGAELVHLRVDATPGRSRPRTKASGDQPASAADGDPTTSQGREARAAGAGAPAMPKVQAQTPLPTGGEATWIDTLLEAAVGRVATEAFPPRSNDGCERCAFQRSCPTQPAGRQVVE